MDEKKLDKCIESDYTAKPDEDAPNCCWYFDPSYNRFIAMGLVCWSGLLFTTVYDLPGSMETEIESTFDIQPYEYEYLYSAYSFPNVVLGFFSGVLIDKVLGVRLGAILLGTIALVAQIIFTVGAFVHIYWLMVAGRFLLGVGLESISIPLNCYCIIWCKGKELSFMFGIFQSLVRAGTSVIFLIVPLIHSYAEKKVAATDVLGVTVTPSLILMFINLINLIVLGQFSLNCGKKVGRASSDIGDNNTSLKDIIKLPFIFWLLALMLAACSTVTYAFLTCSQQLLATKYNMSSAEANKVSSMMTIITAVLSPVVGLSADKIGRDISISALGILLGIVSQIILACTSWTPYIFLAMYAVDMCIFNSCAWPLVSFVVQDFQIATAYGTAAAITNLALTVSNLFIGYLLGRFGPIAPLCFFITLLIVGLMLILTTYIVDSKGGRVMNMTAKQKKTIMAESHNNYSKSIQETSQANDNKTCS